MATLHGSILGPFRQSYRYLVRPDHHHQACDAALALESTLEFGGAKRWLIACTLELTPMYRTVLCRCSMPCHSLQQRSAHEQPVIFYSIAIGLVGPLMVLVVPEVRRSWGWRPAERPPTTYPLPSRARDASVEGFED
ncbi:BZ3500_MvSof-1268-A1-R1_Chr1-3g01670 [Microbotryum saponariae]|uniref:BZ3500_MvSof-1268-A1-R1_Chr1-3g01670 protein n=1 Tax=Microbotryum saponariae TaxID=289078 RepID=A0A2X0KUN3_9BASI|nr:BZ3500_MvSof-1268-A1-R1_Chr1-3g01670 [Microbotryum saponariae]SCZ94283.1 BZ3501_MvSof-1269-A2-R1_Chr1-3g01271 [Microbotryum saponariae]